MKNTHTFSILFWLKLASAKNGKAPLYARITVNGKRAELSLKRKVLISHWDAHRNKLKGLSGETRLINTYLEQVHTKLFDCYRKLQSENKLISSRIIKVNFLGLNENRYALSDIIEYHNEHMRETLRWGTQKNYFTTHKYLFLFLNEKLNTTDIKTSRIYG